MSHFEPSLTQPNNRLHVNHYCEERGSSKFFTEMKDVGSEIHIQHVASLVQEATILRVSKVAV